MKNCVFLLCLIWTIQLNGQVPSGQFVTEMNISNVLFEHPAFFDQLVSDKRIILLGELDHGDGSSFEVKTDLIKYLHETHGFNTLVMEAGMIDCSEIWKSKSNLFPINLLSKKHIYYIWSQVKETNSLFKYIDNEFGKENELKVIGIDPQFSGSENEMVFTNLLRKTLPKSAIENTKFKELVGELKIMSHWLKFPKDDEHQIDETTFHAHLDYFKEQVFSIVDKEEKELWKQYFENVKVLAEIKWTKREGSFEKRDQQMFNNLKHFLDQNPDEKVIVWAANAHIIRKDIELTGKHSKHILIGLKKLGDHIYNEFSEEVYSIAIAAGSGKTLNYLNKKKTNKIGKHKSDSLEGRLKKFNTAFIDLKQFEKINKLDKYQTQLFYTNIKCTSKWSNHFDGVIFIKEMKPSTALW